MYLNMKKCQHLTLHLPATAMFWQCSPDPRTAVQALLVCMVLSIDPLLSSSLAKAQNLDILLLAMDFASAEDLHPSITTRERGYLHQTPDVLHIKISNHFSCLTF